VPAEAAIASGVVCEARAPGVWRWDFEGRCGRRPEWALKGRVVRMKTITSRFTGGTVGVWRGVGVLLAAVVLGVLVGGASAFAAPSGGWLVRSAGVPSYIAPDGEGRILVSVENLGVAAVSGVGVPVRVVDELPAGFEVTGISGSAGFGIAGAFGFLDGEVNCVVAEASCTWSGEHLFQYESLVIAVTVKALANASSGVGEVSVSGGETPAVTARQPVTVSGGVVPFGVENYRLAVEEEGGLPDTRAGSHPFQLTSSLALNQTADPLQPPALVDRLGFALPAGLIGTPLVVARCTAAQFLAKVQLADDCPADSAIGVANVIVDLRSNGPFAMSVPVFNLVPGVGEPARFGFLAAGVPITLSASLRNGGDYGVTVTANNTPQFAALQIVQVTFWGVPGDPRHDAQRGWGCIPDGRALSAGAFGCAALGAAHSRPLLTLPTSCTGPLSSPLSVVSWPTRAFPEGIASAPFPSEPIPGMEGCERIPFTPELSLTPETQAGGTPTGVTADIHIPQLENPEGIAEGNLRKAVVTLPAGVAIDPAGANGLGACTPGQIGLGNANPDTCPESSKVGTAEAISPALKTPLQGSVYVAQQANNPFGSLLALYLVLEGEGVRVKVAGEVHLDPVTGQLTTTFDNLPQQAVEDIRLHFFGGAHAPLSTPVGCWTYTTTSRLTPYSSPSPAEPSSAFQVTGGPNGSGCGPQGFGPSFTAGTVNNQAGGFSPLSVTFSRSDQEQTLAGVTVTTPPGLLGILKSVTQCPEPQAVQGTCGVGSLIGHVTTTAGAGLDPVSVTGRVFLTGPYKGAPFGLSIVVPAAVGPFNLGNVIVRAAISVDPHTAQITVTADPLPTILQGVPLQIRTVNVSIDREGFMFNPTDCEPLTVGGTLSSTQGATANVSSHFEAANCANLAFKPSFTVSTQAATSKKSGASLDVKVGYPAGSHSEGHGQANLRSASVTLPKQLPSRLSTIQQACPEGVFAANPASCPAGSNIGIGTATTPVLSNPVTGPAYLVSHGGAAFPDLVLILQGEGVKLELVGSINIKKNITSSTFASIPDAPISSFELKLPEGPHSGLAAVIPAKAKGSLCGTNLTMPFTITGQNGAVLKQTIKIQVTGCARTKSAKRHRAGKRKRKG
jgi:hypothetical protein